MKAALTVSLERSFRVLPHSEARRRIPLRIALRKRDARDVRVLVVFGIFPRSPNFVTPLVSDLRRDSGGGRWVVLLQTYIRDLLGAYRNRRLGRSDLRRDRTVVGAKCRGGADLRRARTWCNGVRHGGSRGLPFKLGDHGKLVGHRSPCQDSKLEIYIQQVCHLSP